MQKIPPWREFSINTFLKRYISSNVPFIFLKRGAPGGELYLTFKKMAFSYSKGAPVHRGAVGKSGLFFLPPRRRAGLYTTGRGVGKDPAALGLSPRALKLPSSFPGPRRQRAAGRERAARRVDTAGKGMANSRYRPAPFRRDAASRTKKSIVKSMF